MDIFGKLGLTLIVQSENNKESIIDFTQLQDDSDLRALVCTFKNGLLHYLEILPSNLRRNFCVNTKSLARCDTVANTFAWRLARWIREEGLPRDLSPPLSPFAIKAILNSNFEQCPAAVRPLSISGAIFCMPSKNVSNCRLVTYIVMPIGNVLIC